jgi:ParB/RepB/Spo0J family partition protein
MANTIQSISLERLLPHPDNPNRMSKVNLAKLIRNIQHTGRYEPLVVRPHPQRAGYFQIINGHHRHQALLKIGYKTADAVAWDINDAEADILLATLNRLTGSDVLEKKLTLLKKLTDQMQPTQLAKLLPQSASQLERLTNLKLPTAPAKTNTKVFATPLVFFLDSEQLKTVEEALALAMKNRNEKTKAAKKAAALNEIARHFLNKHPLTYTG